MGQTAFTRSLALALAALFMTTTAAAAPASSAPGGFYTGNDVWRQCGSTAEGPATASCLAYVAGVMDGGTFVGLYDDKHGVCLPDGLTLAQATDVARQYLRDHPQTRHTSAGTAIVVSLMLAFPCPEKPSRR